MSRTWEQIPSDSMEVLDSYILDKNTDILHTTGDKQEHITGNKIFDTNRGPQLEGTFDISVTPSENEYRQFCGVRQPSTSSYHPNDLQTYLEVGHYTNGAHSLNLVARGFKDDGTANHSVVKACISADGTTTWGEAPTPVTSANDVKIATTAWMYNRMHQFCTNPMRTTLWSGSAGSGAITLNQSYKNFDFICVVIQNDSKVRTWTELSTTWELDLRRSYGTSWCIVCGNVYWMLNANSTETQWNIDTENATLREVIGLKF